MSYQSPSTRAEAHEAALRAQYLEGLLGRLRDALRTIEGAGYRVCWITAGPEELVRLFEDGGDSVIRLDPDPATDRAWIGSYELKPTETSGVFVYLEGEHPEMSRHCI
jgi:hypothetical protein